jgi:hypothetical protein
MLFSVGYTLPYDWSGVIFSLWKVQNFLVPPSGNPLMYLLVGGQISQTKTSVGGLNQAFFQHLRQQKRGKKALTGVYIGKWSINFKWMESRKVCIRKMKITFHHKLHKKYIWSSNIWQVNWIVIFKTALQVNLNTLFLRQWNKKTAVQQYID